jgi:hypothetical protein
VEVGDYYTIFYPMLEVNIMKYHMCSSRLSIAIKYCLKIYAPCSYCKYTEELRKEENQFILQANITNWQHTVRRDTIQFKFNIYFCFFSSNKQELCIFVLRRCNDIVLHNEESLPLKLIEASSI